MRTILVLLCGLAVTFTESKTTDIQLYCPSHNPQRTLDLKLLMGTWYIVEIVHHQPHEGLTQIHELNLESCPTIHLVQDDFSNIRLIWSEDSLTVYYHVKRSDPQAPGLWVASGPHKEALVEHRGQNSPFSGTIEVMKAVGNHAVLTFCKSDHEDSQLFSVVLARETWLPRADTRGVNRMLTLRGLHPVLIKRTCSGAANLALASFLLVLVTSALFL